MVPYYQVYQIDEYLVLIPCSEVLYKHWYYNTIAIPGVISNNKRCFRVAFYLVHTSIPSDIELSPITGDHSK